MLIVWIAGMIASVVLSFIHLGFIISLLFPLIGLAYLILVIIAGIKANNGEDYKVSVQLPTHQVGAGTRQRALLLKNTLAIFVRSSAFRRHNGVWIPNRPKG